MNQQFEEKCQTKILQLENKPQVIVNQASKEQHVKQYQQYFGDVLGQKNKDHFKNQNAQWFNKTQLSQLQTIQNEFYYQLALLSRNFQVLKVFAKYKFYKMTINMLNCQNKSKMHNYPLIFTGKNTSIYFFEYQNKKYAIKCFQFKKQFKFYLGQVLRQYFLLKIAEHFKVGPSLQNFQYFDIVVYEDCIEFVMQYCGTSLQNIQNIENKLKQCLKTLHFLNIVHSDIKPANVGYSNKFKRYIFLDYGYSQVIRQHFGYKTLTNFKGTLQFCSEEMRDCFSKRSSMQIDLYYNDYFCLKTMIESLKRSNFQQGISMSDSDSSQDVRYEMKFYKPQYVFNGKIYRKKIKKIDMNRLKYLLTCATHQNKTYKLQLNKYSYLISDQFSQILRFITQINYNQFNSSFIVSNYNRNLAYYKAEQNRYIESINKKRLILNYLNFSTKKQNDQILLRYQQFSQHIKTLPEQIRQIILQIFNVIQINMQQMVIIAQAIAFQNMNLKIQAKHSVSLFIVRTLKIQIQDQQTRSKYCILLCYLFQKARQPPYNKYKLQVIQSLVVTFFILQLVYKQDLLGCLEKLLLQPIQLKQKLRIIINFLNGLMWIQQKPISKVKKSKLWSETIKLISNFCNSWKSQSILQNFIKQILIYIISNLQNKTKENIINKFKDYIQYWRQSDSTKIYWIVYDYYIFLLVYESQKICITYQYYKDILSICEQHILNRISFEMQRSRFNYYDIVMAKYYLFTNQIQLFICYIQKLKVLATTQDGIQFKIFSQFNVKLCSLETSHNKFISFVFSITNIEQFKQINTAQSRLWFIATVISGISRVKVQQVALNQINFEEFLQKIQIMIKYFVESEDYLQVLQQRPSYFFRHKIVQNIQKIVFILLYIQISPSFQLFDIDIQSAYQKCCLRIAKINCMNCKYQSLFCLLFLKTIKKKSHLDNQLLYELQYPFYIQYKKTQRLNFNLRFKNIEYYVFTTFIAEQDTFFSSKLWEFILLEMQLATETIDYLKLPAFNQISRMISQKIIQNDIVQCSQLFASIVIEVQKIKYNNFFLRKLYLFQNQIINKLYQNGFSFNSIYDNISQNILKPLFQSKSKYYIYCRLIAYFQTDNQFVDSQIKKYLYHLNFLHGYIREECLGMYYCKILTLDNKYLQSIFLKKKKYKYICKKLIKLNLSQQITKSQKYRSVQKRIKLLFFNAKIDKWLQRKENKLLFNKFNKIRE